jgi:hypothetical protein
LVKSSPIKTVSRHSKVPVRRDRLAKEYCHKDGDEVPDRDHGDKNVIDDPKTSNGEQAVIQNEE